jgi:hypothetical protein
MGVGEVLRVVLAAAIATGGVGYAATQTTTLRGEVSDILGYPLPGAVVIVTDQSLATSQSATTASSGGYVLTNLQPGRYKVEVKMPGFKTFVSDDLTLAAGGTAVVDVKLSLEELPSHLGQASGNFFFGTQRKAQSETEKELIKKAEELPCPAGGWWKTIFDGVRLPTCLNSEAIAYYEALVDGYKGSGSGSRPARREHARKILSAQGEYIATVTFRPEPRQWVVELRLEYRHWCGNVCGLLFLKTREVVFDETKKVVKVVGDGEAPHSSVS